MSLRDKLRGAFSGTTALMKRPFGIRRDESINVIEQVMLWLFWLLIAGFALFFLWGKAYPPPPPAEFTPREMQFIKSTVGPGVTLEKAKARYRAVKADSEARAAKYVAERHRERKALKELPAAIEAARQRQDDTAVQQIANFCATSPQGC